MNNDNTSRRNLLLMSSAIALPRLASAQEKSPPLTAEQVIDRIKENIGVSWREQTVDKIIASIHAYPTYSFGIPVALYDFALNEEPAAIAKVGRFLSKLT